MYLCFLIISGWVCPPIVSQKTRKQMKKNRILCIATMLCGLLACHAQTNGYESLSVEAYEQTIADTSVVRLDVRTAAEFAEGHIYKAVNIDVLKPDFEQKAVASLPKNRLIAVNCRSGKRSKNAANILVHNGYKVVELDNGYLGWVAAGKKVVK